MITSIDTPCLKLSHWPCPVMEIKIHKYFRGTRGHTRDKILAPPLLHRSCSFFCLQSSSSSLTVSSYPTSEPLLNVPPLGMSFLPYITYLASLSSILQISAHTENVPSRQRLHCLTLASPTVLAVVWPFPFGWSLGSAPTLR